MADELEALKKQLAAAKEALSKEAEDTKQAKETLEKEREELRRTKEYEAQLTEYLKQTGITRPEFTKSHTEVQNRVDFQLQQLQALQNTLDSSLDVLPTTPAEVGKVVMANSEVSTQVKSMFTDLTAQIETLAEESTGKKRDSVTGRFSTQSDALEEMAKRAEEAVEQEVQQLDEAIGTVSEAVKTGIPPVSLDQAYQILLDPPSSERMAASSTHNDVADRIGKANEVIQTWLGSTSTFEVDHRTKYEQQLKAASIELRKQEKVLASFIESGHHEEAKLFEQEMDELIKRAASYQRQLLYWQS